jgi:uncharacterized coiled-coil protein SlyX
MAEEIKVAILEQKLEDLKDIIVKIDDAIEKLSEVNSNVTKMLAVHEQRLTNSVIKLTGIMTHLLQEYNP